jgi:hypothetical protein
VRELEKELAKGHVIGAGLERQTKTRSSKTACQKSAKPLTTDARELPLANLGACETWLPLRATEALMLR